jgi:hypothetical protein
MRGKRDLSADARLRMSLAASERERVKREYRESEEGRLDSEIARYVEDMLGC